MATVLVPLADGFEEIEALAPIDLLRRAGVDVTAATLNDNRHATGRSGVTVHGDIALKDLAASPFDMLFLPGGPGVAKLRADPRIKQLVIKHYDSNRWLAAICAAPTVLADAGLLVGRRFTAHHSVARELPEALLNEKVVTDGRLTTSRGAGTAVEFGLHLVGLLVSSEKATEIGESICL